MNARTPSARYAATAASTSARSRHRRWSITAVVPDKSASTPQCIADTATAAAGVFTQESAPAQPLSPRGSWRMSCRTHSSSGRGLMRPLAQCSTLCVCPFTRPGMSMRSSHANSAVPEGH